MKSKTYFVSYAHSKGFGNVEIEVGSEVDIKSIQDIKNIEKYLIERENVDSPLVLNFIFLFETVKFGQ